MKSAFTLIELVVTIAVIGVISSIALAQYSTYQKNAYHTLALQNVLNASTALEARNVNLSGTDLSVHILNSVYITGSSSDLPGYIPNDDMVLTVNYFSPTHSVVANRNIKSFAAQHCKGPSGNRAWVLHSRFFPKTTDVSGYFFLPGCS